MIRNKKSLIVLFLIAFFILCLPYFFRFFNGNHVFMDSEAHYHARMGSEIAKHGLIGKDSLSGVKYKLNPYHMLLAVAGFFVPIEFASMFVPMLLGLLSVLFLYLSFADIGLKYLRSWFVLLVFILSPIFISSFSLSSPRALAVFLLSFGFYLFQKKSAVLFLFSLPALGMLAFLGPAHSIMLLVILLAYCLHSRRLFSRFYLVLAIVLLLGMGFHLPYYLVDYLFLVTYGGVISDFGSVYGFGVFSLLLSVMGLFFIWRYKKKLYLVYLLMLMLLFVSFVTRAFFIYSNLVVSILAGSAFYVLYVKNWQLKNLQSFALLVVFCGFLFSALSHSLVLSGLPPNDALVGCLEWAEKSTPEKSRFLAHEGDAFFVEFWAERPVLLDELNMPEKVVRDAGIIWQSFDIEETRRLLSANHVDYVLIHAGLFDGRLWDKRGQGLHFLLDNVETFKRRYHNDYCEVWEYVYYGELND